MTLRLFSSRLLRQLPLLPHRSNLPHGAHPHLIRLRHGRWMHARSGAGESVGSMETLGCSEEAPRVVRPKRKLNKMSPAQQMYIHERANLVDLLRAKDAEGALAWYSRVRQSGLKMDDKLYSTLLSALISGLNPHLNPNPIINPNPNVNPNPNINPNSSVNLNDRKRIDTRSAAVDQVYSDMVEQGLNNEASESLMIRAFCQQGLPEKAERIVAALRERGETVRPRTLEPLLEGYCRHVQNDLASVEAVKRVYADLKRALSDNSIELETGIICAVIDGLLRFLSLEGATEEFKVAVFELEEIVVADIGNFVRVGDDKLIEKLEEWFDRAHGIKRRSCRVAWTGVCKDCDHQLHSKELAREVEMGLVRDTEDLVTANEPKNTRERMMQRWDAFKKWLDRKEAKLGDRGGYDCVVDVANVAYYHSNGLNSKLQFNYSSVQCLVNFLESKNQRCLLIMHENHVSGKDCRTVQDREILREWRAKEMIYLVPRGFLDDYFWLYAALVRGGRTLIVSNDWMRDHHFTLLKQTSFQRWREQHQVRFRLTWDPETRELTEPVVLFPTPYTRHAQVEYYDDPTVAYKEGHRIKRGLYLPGNRIQSVHIPVSKKKVRKSERGKQLPVIRDIPKHGDLSWVCWRKS